jgi:hypothetical protein
VGCGCTNHSWKDFDSDTVDVVHSARYNMDCIFLVWQSVSVRITNSDNRLQEEKQLEILTVRMRILTCLCPS